jgi:predicted nucleic acid-binding protein
MAAKSTPPAQRVYWDTNLFLHHLNATDIDGNLDSVRAILEDARQGRVQIFTSYLAGAEIAFITADLVEAPAFAHEADIEALWHMYPAIVPVPGNMDIARLARSLIRWRVQQNRTGMHVPKLSVHDIVHLATAVYAKVDEIHTCETQWAAYAIETNIPVLRPKDHYSQPSLFDA